MTIWDFFDGHWFLAFLTLCSVYYLAIRLTRMVMVVARGWPLPPMDADGDVRSPNAEGGG